MVSDAPYVCIISVARKWWGVWSGYSRRLIRHHRNMCTPVSKRSLVLVAVYVALERQSVTG